MYELFMSICMDLWSGDVPITYEIFKEHIKQCIENLESHIGAEAHLKEQSLGIVDETGQTWEEQDANARKQIARYQELLDYLENDHNWTL